MKVNELMVGDWVMFPNSIEKVQEVAYVEGKGYCASFAASATLFPIPIDKLKPIPLTDEILEKNGFVFVDGYGCMRWMDEEGSRSGGREVLWSQLTRVLQIRAEGVCLDYFGCYYFHELQNILTVMKIGKEIKP